MTIVETGEWLIGALEHVSLFFIFWTHLLLKEEILFLKPHSVVTYLANAYHRCHRREQKFHIGLLSLSTVIRTQDFQMTRVVARFLCDSRASYIVSIVSGAIRSPTDSHH